MRFYRFLGGKIEAIVGKTSECIGDVFEGLKMAIKASWENIKENYLVVFAIIGLLPLFFLVMKYIGG